MVEMYQVYFLIIHLEHNSFNFRKFENFENSLYLGVPLWKCWIWILEKKISQIKYLGLKTRLKTKKHSKINLATPSGPTIFDL